MKIPFIDNPFSNRNSSDARSIFSAHSIVQHLARQGADSELESRIASYELAFQMQMGGAGRPRHLR